MGLHVRQAEPGGPSDCCVQGCQRSELAAPQQDTVAPMKMAMGEPPPRMEPISRRS